MAQILLREVELRPLLTLLLLMFIYRSLLHILIIVFLFGHILAMSNLSFSFFLLYSELEYTDTMHVSF
jgi:hypothetical protein